MKLYDNNGATMDRYTLVDEHTNAVYGLSDNPLSPHGFNQYCGTLEENIGVDKSGDLMEADTIRELSRDVLLAIVLRLI